MIRLEIILLDIFETLQHFGYDIDVKFHDRDSAAIFKTHINNNITPYTTIVAITIQQQQFDTIADYVDNDNFDEDQANISLHGPQTEALIQITSCPKPTQALNQQPTKYRKFL